ncbi:phosphatase [Anopheles sinensis]|uniref:Phosphatase n=1 Tax=Anopheles sinensis TaxID=74873 RepID=A0A084VQ75_ANOSI|nr:phosphatase [Anopheles sinensis]
MWQALALHPDTIGTQRYLHRTRRGERNLRFGFGEAATPPIIHNRLGKPTGKVESGMEKHDVTTVRFLARLTATTSRERLNRNRHPSIAAQ